MNSVNWQQNYQEQLLYEIKSLLREALNCAQLPPLERIYSLATTRLSLQDLFTEIPKICQRWYQDVVEQNYLTSYVDDSTINELIFYQSDSMQLLRHNQAAEYLNHSLISAEDFYLSLQILAIRYGIDWNFSNPFASFTVNFKQQLFRATLIHPSIEKNNRPRFFLRRIRDQVFELHNFSENQELISKLRQLIEQKANILIAGPTGSGKTSLLSSLMSLVGKSEHIIALEDTDELVCHSPCFTKLLSKAQKNKELSDYMSYALRMSPERIILGEMRSHEVIPFILATNTGHKGLMATIHANSAKEAVERVATLFAVYNQSVDMAHRHIQNLITRNIDYIIFVKNKKIEEIIKPMGHEGDHLLYIEEYSACSSSH